MATWVQGDRVMRRGPGGRKIRVKRIDPRRSERGSAYDALNDFLKAMGINIGPGIRDIIENAVQDGIGPEQIDLILPDIQETRAWRQRFPGWHSRTNNGYNQLSVAEYLQLENSYHRILQEAGLPKGFYDDPSDFGNWIAKNVSVDEIQNRVGMAVDAVRKVDPTARELLNKFYGVTSGDLASYFLDQERALPALEKQYRASNVAAYAVRHGMKLDTSTRYESLVERGVTAEQAASGYGTVAAFSDTLGQLGDIYGEQYSQRDAEEDVFFNASEKRQRILAKETANFSGSSRGSTGSAQRGTSY